MAVKKYKADVVIVGGGIAGIVTAMDLLEAGLHVILVDRDKQENFGGLAKESFGGVFMVGTKHQKRNKIQDSPELAWEDWKRTAQFSPKDIWPQQWAKFYVENSIEYIYEYMLSKGIRFFPVVHWPERGLFRPGNSVPRFHMAMGTGEGIIRHLTENLLNSEYTKNLTLLFEHRVTRLLVKNRAAQGIAGKNEADNSAFEIDAPVVVIASGGICGGDLKKLRRNWYKPWGKPPEVILNGSHQFADGSLHDLVSRYGAKITHLDKQWNYAAGVHHPKPRRDNHGLSLVPPKSALWVNYRGERIGPMPLITQFDTRFLVEQICKQKKKYSWQILNRKIAVKELAVSGSEHNEAFQEGNYLKIVKTVLLGNPKLVNYLTENCIDFVTANSVRELAEKMNQLTGTKDVDADLLEKEIREYDANIERGKFYNDEQLRRIRYLREYRGDRLRTCNMQKIVDKKAMPLIAIREFILSRKSLGGIQTDLESRILSATGKPISGFYAVGEAAGFGGGGIHGIGSLEGTFLGSCVLTARRAAKSIRGQA
ncbi:MAG: FAD-binding dehydrogenase [Candidatus Hydrogenedentota bacterium]|nr:MAG: FAD-binding dehydrogenase [Candidatus Hydrogenedentota bacterium]